MLFNEYGGANVGVTNFVSCFYMLIPTKANIQLANGKMGHVQLIGVILCLYPNYPLYIQWYQFTTFQVNITIPPHRLPLNVMLVLKVYI